MCTSSYKAPKVQPTPPAPPAPVEGAQAPVINDGSPGGTLGKLSALAASFNSLVVPYKGPGGVSVDTLQSQVGALQATHQQDQQQLAMGGGHPSGSVWIQNSRSAGGGYWKAPA